jgi:hypothetical protein
MQSNRLFFFNSVGYLTIESGDARSFSIRGVKPVKRERNKVVAFHISFVPHKNKKLRFTFRSSET